MKSTYEKLFLGAAATLVVGLGIVYATEIKTTNQKANQGDVITADWVNNVNEGLNSVGAAGAGGGVACSADGLQCIFADGTCRVKPSGACIPTAQYLKKYHAGEVVGPFIDCRQSTSKIDCDRNWFTDTVVLANMPGNGPANFTTACLWAGSSDNMSWMSCGNVLQ